ncbi:hypothetical protein COCNU_07G009650 [Cocos nucifera]|uniref:Uncharacterized protein n=1 Tax=Cocos nucifera TaxID=13894 RepID=A0A8K0IGM5_COCNU|nr:hypothetical protein COCNU_07G009650 [Cocos nucifera]
MDDLHNHHQSFPPPPLAGFPWEPPLQDASGITAEELKEAFLRTTLELESTRIAAHEELQRMESHALHLTNLLEIATRERDEARALLLVLLMDHNHHLASNSNRAAQLDEGSNAAAAAGGLSSPSSSDGGRVEEERSNYGTSSSAGMAAVEAAALRRGLPEKGRLLEAVVAAGPLLQTLLLAGPLPRWRHPPPALQTLEIPPVSMGLLNTGNNPVTRREREEVDATTMMGSGVERSLSLPNSSTSSPETECNNSCGVSDYRRISSFHL